MTPADFQMFCAMASLFVSNLANEARVANDVAGRNGRALYWRTRAVVVADRTLTTLLERKP